MALDLQRIESVVRFTRRRKGLAAKGKAALNDPHYVLLFLGVFRGEE